MGKEAIKEVAEQLGKGIDWVEDELVPYMYGYAEYKFVFYLIVTVVMGLTFIIGALILAKGVYHTVKRDEIYRNDTNVGLLIAGGGMMIFGLMVGLLTLETTLSWGIAPEVTFVMEMTE